MNDPTVTGLLISATTALAGCVVYLWKQISKHYEAVGKRADECTQRLAELNMILNDLSNDVQHLDDHFHGEDK